MSRIEKAAWSAAGLLLCFSVFIQFYAGFIGDKDWLLRAAHLWLGGKQLYRDIFEIDPPLIVWIMALPVWISGHLGAVPDYYVLAVLGLAASALSVAVCTLLIGRHPQFAGNGRRRAQWALLLAFILVFFANPAYFFDRDHLLFALTLPYLLRFMPTLAPLPLPRILRIVIAVMAAVGFCVKPHNIILFACVQMICIARERSPRILWSLENLVVYALGAAYLAAAAWLYPDYLRVILPMALATYSGYNMRDQWVVQLAAPIFTLLGTFVDFRRVLASPYRRDLRYFLWLGIGFAVYALANNGWGYTFYPLDSLLLLVTGWVMWDSLWLKEEEGGAGRPVRPFVFTLRNGFIVFGVHLILTLGVAFAALTARCDDDADCRMDRKLAAAADAAHARSFGALAINFRPWPVLMREHGLAMETRFNHLWMLPAFVTSGEEFTRAHQWIFRYLADAYADDLDAHRPDIVFVDASPEFFTTRHRVDLVAYFSASPRFAAAWSHYALRESADVCPRPGGRHDEKRSGCRYDVYARLP